MIKKKLVQQKRQIILSNNLWKQIQTTKQQSWKKIRKNHLKKLNNSKKLIKKTKIKNQLQYSWRKNKTFQLSHQLKKKLKLFKHQKQLRHQKQILKLKSNQQMLKKLLRKMQQKYLLLLLLQIYLHQLQQRVFLLHKVNLRRNCNSRRKQIRNLMKKANQSLQTNHL